MASLAPGVLSKLLDYAENKNVRVTGEHHPALPQVIENVPCFAIGEIPWQSRGYFFKVYSKHYAYVSVFEENVDLIYNDKIQMGQFVYVTHLDSMTTSLVLILRVLKLVPNKRPYVKNPVDLNSSESLRIGSNLDFKKPKKGSSKRNEGTKAKAIRGSPLKSNTKVMVEGLQVRRLSLDSARKGWDQSPSSNKSSYVAPTSRFKSKSTPSNDSVCGKLYALLFICLFFFAFWDSKN